jgi:hypothetical protein
MHLRRDGLMYFFLTIILFIIILFYQHHYATNHLSESVTIIPRLTTNEKFRILSNKESSVRIFQTIFQNKFNYLDMVSRKLFSNKRYG